MNNKKVQIRSMTGYGKAAVKSPFGTVNVEVKSFNHKHLSIACTAFEGFFLLEEQVKGIFEKKVLRGKIFVNISLDEEKQKKPIDKIQIDKALAMVYLNGIKKLQKDLSLKGEVSIRDIIKLPGVIKQNNAKAEGDLWPFIQKGVVIALDQLVRYREEEGKKLAKDFAERIKKISRCLHDIKVFEKECITGYRTKLTGMIKNATDKEEVNKSKLEEEVALFARNCDIAEEITRLGNHIEACLDGLKSAKEDIGKKLDFIAQEMHRETNTIGSKASDYRISNAVIEIKSEIEKIREQLKNIE